MDPVSALGVAAAALQFLDAAVKAYNAFREIRSSAESSTERNKKLEDNIRAAQNLRSSLMPAVSASQGTTDPVTELTARCASKADELLDLLEYVRGSGKDISSIRATLRAVKKGDKIEKLRSSLVEDRVTLDQMISQKLLSSVDLLAVAQSQEFANLSSSVQKLVSDLVEQRKAQEVNNTILASKVDSVHYDMRLRFNDTDRLMMRENILKSLFFPDIDQRRSSIKEPAPSTLDWLFEPTSDKDLDLGAKWSNFRQWLREDTSTYWISGKAGSGKSTLMAHIVDDKRTRQELDAWSSGHKLEVLSFFFWRAGSQLQNSVLGLLRSLLYQLCILQPAIVDTVVSRLLSPAGMMPTWTERSLLNHASEAIQSSKGHRFCIFIDGLDEYTGSYDHLVDYIDQLQSSRNVKFCVSSRPELELVERFRDLKQLRLQDLNQSGIHSFVKQSLRRTKLNKNHRAHLARVVVQRAEGVFLWASLVTQSLVKGSKACDNEEIMQKRLDSLPRDMNQLFERMLSDIDPVYQKSSLAFYVQLMKLITEHDWLGKFVNIAIIAAAQLDKPTNSYEEFAKKCECTETQIATQSAGLLEVYEDWTSPPRKDEWETARIKYVSNQPRFTLGAEGLDRRRCPENEPYPVMLNYENRRIKWMHRSAFEFLSNLRKENSPFELSLNREELLSHIGNSYIRYIVAAPSFFDYIQRYEFTTSSSATERDKSLFNFVSSWYSRYPTAASGLLDKLYGVYARYDLDELHGAKHRTSFNPNTTIYTGGLAFWIGCTDSEFEPYILSRMKHILEDPACDTIIAHLLTESLDRFYLHSIDLDSGSLPRFIDSLSGLLLQRMVQRLEIGGIAQTTKYKCIGRDKKGCSIKPHHFFLGKVFTCATWKELVTGATTAIMTRLIYILGLFFVWSVSTAQTLLPMPESLSTLMDITDLGMSYTKRSL
ncbi:hypothetical protein F4801DRAFT_326808 [Xylaria longipes]|nr:hypothetical protein F4801DRAFT_326808 [Xylaria longipes]